MHIPGSVRTIKFVLYAQIAYFIVLLGLAFSAPPEGGINFGVLAVNIVIVIAPIGLCLYFVNKKKYLPSLLMLLLAFLLSSNDPIKQLLTVVALLMFFPRSTREYFGKLPMGAFAKPAGAASPVAARERTEVGEAPAEGEPAAEEAADKPSALMRAASIEVTVREAGPEDAEVVHGIMMEAFEEFRSAIPPSSALDETVDSVRDELSGGESFAALLYEDDEPVAMVRYRLEDDGIFFYRLAVVPSKRRRGYASRLIAWIETTGLSKGLRFSRCQVRQSVQSNLRMYQDRGYEIVDTQLVVRAQGTVKALKLEKKIGA